MSFSVRSGEIVGLIGPNGAGKTTLFNCAGRLLKADSRADPLLDGAEIAGFTPEAVAALGLARTFQIVRVFPAMTVLENVMVGAMLTRPGRGGPRPCPRGGGASPSSASAACRDIAGALTIAEQKRLEVARALATAPKLILLDEIMAGLTPIGGRRRRLAWCGASDGAV